MKILQRSSPILREEIHETTLSCGLKTLVVPKPHMTRKVAIMAARYGSIDLSFKPDGREAMTTTPGIAHFLEHQLFKKQDRDVLMEFGRFGASSNAFTDYTTTCYYFSCTEQFEPALRLLLDLVFAPYFDESYVAKEKLIIEQELRMYEDQPDHKIYKNLLEILYREHPVRIDIGGTVENIQTISPDLLESCYRMFYNPANTVLVIAGDLQIDPVVKNADETLSAGPMKTHPPIGRISTLEPAGVVKPHVQAEMLVARPRVLVGFKDLDGDSDLLTRDITMTILLDLLFGRSSPFFNKHYAGGLIDDSFSFSTTMEPSFGFSVVGGETDDPERLRDEIFKEIRSARRRPMKRTDVERARRKSVGRYIRSFDSSDGAAFFVMTCHMRDIDPFSIGKAIGRIRQSTLEERLCNHLVEDNAATSILRPA